MDNTIENAQLYFDELRHTEQPVFVPITTAGIMVAYTNKITASKDQRIAELEDKIRVLDFKLQGAYADIDDCIIDQNRVNEKKSELEKENADLRRALSECKAKARIGVNQNH